MSLNYLDPNFRHATAFYRCEALGCDSGFATRVGEVTQITSATTAVELNEISGIITTVSLTNAGDTPTIFRCNNQFCAEGKIVKVNINAYSGTWGTNGNPSVQVNDVGNGYFDVVVWNSHPSNALSGTLKIAFQVLNKLNA